MQQLWMPYVFKGSVNSESETSLEIGEEAETPCWQGLLQTF